MSLLKGIQSAIFYYLSCAPCAQLAHKKRRRKQAEVDRAERAILEMEQPGLYRHPSPFATNPYWEEEIGLGPGPPPRRAKKKTKDTAARGIASAGTQSTRGSISNSDGETEAVDKTVHADRRHALNPKHWNFRRYQREDEALWGQSFDKASTETSIDASSRGPPGSKRSDANYSRTDTMYIARNPPVNDLHPPVVSTPSSNLNETRWMLQPPPTAKVMSGKERANSNRSRSSTTASRSAFQLRIPEVKAPNMSQETNGADRTPTQQPFSREISLNNGLTPTRTSSSGGRKRRRPEPVFIHTGGSPRSSATAVQGHPPNNEAVEVADFASSAHVAAQRSHKRLSTIISSESAPQSQPQSQSRPLSRKENEPSSSEDTITSGSNHSGSDAGASAGKPNDRRRPLIVSDSSLNILEELVSPSALLNSRFVKAPAVEARISLPPTSSVEDLQLRHSDSAKGGVRLGGLQSWYPKNDVTFHYPWAAGTEVERKDSGMMEIPRDLPRDPRARWSMDI